MFVKEDAMIRSGFYDSVIRLVIGWGVGYFLVRLLTSGMSATEGYAWISGWWLATCLARGRKLRLRHGIYILVAAVIVSVSWLIFGVMTDGDEIGFPYTAIKLLVQAIILASPAYFGVALDQIEVFVLNLRGKILR